MSYLQLEPWLNKAIDANILFHPIVNLIAATTNDDEGDVVQFISFD